MPSYRVPPSVCGDLYGTAPMKAATPTEAVDELRKRFLKQGLQHVASRITIFGLQINSGHGWRQVASDVPARAHRR